MYQSIRKYYSKPKMYEFYTAATLWNDPHISQQLLTYHLSPDVEAASRKHEDIFQSIEFIRNRFNLTQTSKVIDFGCGPGLYTHQFAKFCGHVVGIDLSFNSIAYAAQRAKDESLSIEYLNQNYLDYTGDHSADLATLIYGDYCVLSKEQRLTLLHILSESIKKDGFVFLDVFTEEHSKKFKEGYSIEINETSDFFSSQPHIVASSTHVYKDENVVLEKYAVLEEQREFYIYNWLKHFTLEEIKAELHEAQLKVVDVYGDVCGNMYNEHSLTLALVIQHA